jgi:hypothetical protein
LKNFVKGCRHRGGSSRIKPECQTLLNLNHRRKRANTIDRSRV